MGLRRPSSPTIFAETGLVVAPFLPGESLLLASGTLAGAGVPAHRRPLAAARGRGLPGDVVNYLLGRWIGRRLLNKPRKHLRPEYVEQAHEFYEEHGGLAIVACRFLPVVRTLVPFVAGMARMEFHRYIGFAALASAIWVTIFLGAGYLFGTSSGCRTTSASRWRSPSRPRPSRASSSGRCIICAAAGRMRSDHVVRKCARMRHWRTQGERP